MQYRINILFLLIFIQSLAVAQNSEGNERYLSSAASPDGNYIYLLNEAQLSGKDSSVINSTDYFIIERIPYESISENAKKANTKKIGEARPVQSMKDLKKYYSSEKINELKKLFGLTNDAELLNYFKTHSQIAAYPIVYGFIETKQALCHVFLDDNVKDGQIYVYDVTRVTKNNTKEPWGFTITQSKSGNYTLPYFRPKLTKIAARDSSVAFEWKMPASVETISSIPVPVSKIAEDSGGALYRMPFPPSTIRANVYLENNGTFSEVQKLMPVLNDTRDTITYYFTKKCTPEEPVNVFLLTEDEVHNPGIASDTAYSYAIENKIIPLIYGIRVTDVVNGVQIAWDKLPSKPYLTGVEIVKYNSDDKLDSVAIVPISDTSFIDYKVAVGQQYRYKVKALFLPQLGVEQITPAEGIGSYTKFSKPLQPFNLTATEKKKKIFLKWDAVDEPSYFGSFVYRGTSDKNMELIAGPIQGKSFVDTAAHLSARSEYYYTVVNQNYRQDTSDFSVPVRVVPDKKIETAGPANIEFYYVNGVLRVSWNEVRANDNFIESYIVLKKTTKQKIYTSVMPKPVTTNFIEDADIKDDLTYQYKVAAVSVKGDTSEFSNVNEYTLPAKNIPLVRIFYVRNITEGIKISWPEVTYEGRKGYNIYRREASAKEFAKLTSVSSSTFDYLDKTTRPDKIYVYAMSVTQDNGKEGSRGLSISVRRNKKQ